MSTPDSEVPCLRCLRCQCVLCMMMLVVTLAGPHHGMHRHFCNRSCSSNSTATTSSNSLCSTVFLSLRLLFLVLSSAHIAQ